MADTPKVEKLPTIVVKGAGKDRRVVLWERHPDHPEKKYETDENGEAFVSNDDISREVAETATVKRLLAEGVLVKGNLSDNKKTDVNWNSRTENSTLTTASRPHGLGGRRPKPVTEDDDD